MRLQSRALLILAIIFTMLAGIVYLDSNIRLKRDYLEQETMLANTNLERIINGIQNQKDDLIIYTNPWSQWDEAYHFMSKMDPRFIASNMVPGTFTSGKINFFLFYDTTGKFYYGKAFDIDSNQFIPIPQNLLTYLDEHKSFVTHNDINSKKAGLLSLKEGPVLMSSMPIITGDGNGPLKGSMLMGYYYHQPDAVNIGKIAKLNVTPLALPTDANSPLWPIMQQLKTQPYLIKDVNTAHSYGYLTLNDINNHPIMLLQVDLPRTLYSAGLNTAYHHYLMVLLTSIAVLIATWLLLKKLIIDRILSVSRQIAHIYTEGSFDKRIRTNGDDEINALVKSINAMLELIELTQDQLKYRVSRRTRELEKISELNRNLFTEVGHHKNVEAKLREEEITLKKMAYYDTLTGLPSRGFFLELFNKTIKAADRSEKIALLFLDVDHFKTINDTHGHEFGDHYLKNIAERMKASLSKHDSPGRLAGDEMIMYLGNITDKSSIDATVTRLMQNLTVPMTINNVTFNPSFSIGISVYPDDGLSIDELLRKADLAMYHAKKASGNMYRYYSDVEVKKKLPT